uniref:Armadillo repeat-containing domain-containing protein n=1 Tax=Strigamia maritima TaxID=126957 RepID=T1IHX9_STRMM
MALQRKRNQELQTITFESQALSTIALLLRSTEEDILLKSLGSIMKFVEKSDKNKAEAKSVGILELLVPHLRHSNSSIVKYACMNCGLLASLVDVRVELRSLDIIPILLDILSNSDLYEILIIEYATLTLSNMSIDYHGRNIIIKLNGIPVIAKFLLTRDPDVQKNSVEIFSNLLQNVNAVKVLCDLGGLLSLFRLLKSEFDVIQQLSFLCLVRATSKRQRQINFVDSGGLTILMQILENKAQSEFHVDCLRVEVRDCKALNILTEFLYTPNFELQAAAAACLTNVATVREAREDALRANIIPGDIIVQLNTCTAIAAYICDYEARSQFLQHGIASLVKLLSLSKPEIYLKALWIISTIGVYNEVAVALCEHGIVHLLSQNAKWKNQGNYADLVLERIFSNHLPAKYGYTDDDTPSEAGSLTSIAFRATRDPLLIKYLEDVVETILPISNIHHQANALAKFVSDKMGGKFDTDSIHSYSPELEINHLKYKYTSNALADHIGIPCSLVRGNMRRGWNEVLLPAKRQSSDKERLTEKYIIDLIINPGQLLPIGSIVANEYCCISKV